jgi:hypothetical protein
MRPPGSQFDCSRHFKTSTQIAALRARITLPTSHTSADPVPDVEDKAEDHKDPSPTAHSAANRAVGKDVEQGRIGKDDQPEDRDEEAVECTVHQVRENPDQRESNSWREPGKQCEQTPHPSTFLSGPRSEPVHKTFWKRTRRPDSPTAGERANARQARPLQLACVADQVQKILGIGAQGGLLTSSRPDRVRDTRIRHHSLRLSRVDWLQGVRLSMRLWVWRWLWLLRV